jgi:phosphoglycolate phosphatase-like HAD superfamily hydrolase
VRFGGRVPGGREIVIVGDTPADVTCGRGVGARALGVATGAYTLEDLAAAGAHAVFPDLADTEAVVAALLG